MVTAQPKDLQIRPDKYTLFLALINFGIGKHVQGRKFEREIAFMVSHPQSGKGLRDKNHPIAQI